MQSNYIQLTVTVKDVVNDNKFIIPQFQRNVVWKSKRRTEFIKTVRSGNPFGVILIRENNGKYELIDGLQRISTIKHYIKNPFEYLIEDDVDTDLVMNLVETDFELRNINISKSNNAIDKRVEDIKKSIYECLKGKLKSYQAMRNLRQKFSFEENDNIDDIIHEIYSKFNKSIDISGLQIFAINYVDPSENIPTVFYNLNTGAVSLSKYETYAALWSSPLFKIHDTAILNGVINKYTALQKSSELDVDFDETALSEEGISLFEYCYALSNILRNNEKKFNYVVGENKKSTDPIGFEILSLLLGEKVNMAEKLYDILKGKSPEFLIQLKNVLENSLAAVTKVLLPVVQGLNGKSLCSENTYLLYHILISYILECYIIDVDNEQIVKRKNSMKYENFKKYAPLHYVYDNLRGFWQVNRQITDLHREINDKNSRGKYWFNIKSEDWDSAIYSFMDKQHRSKKTMAFNSELFINFLVKMKLSKQPHFKNYFYNKELNTERYELDYEHIIPKQVLSRSIKDLSITDQRNFPISSIGNICYLTVKDNRSKRNKTIYQYNEDRPSYLYNKEYLDFILYPVEDRLTFLDYSNIDLRKAYYEFLKERENALSKEFLELVKEY